MNLLKVLIISNPLNHEGGVVNYYNLFFKHFNAKDIKLKHHTIGSRAYLFYKPTLKRVLYPFYFIFDVFKFILMLCFDRKIKVVQVSPSLIPVPLIRDGILVLIAKLFRKNVIVFYRGWKLPTLEKLKNKVFLRKIFNRVFQKGTYQIVLASSFKSDLESLSKEESLNIYVTKTAINKSDVIIHEKEHAKHPINVLFLGRVQDIKGVDEIVDTICLLKEKDALEKFKFTIAGHEDKVGYIDSLKKKLEAKNISEKHIVFPGRVVGQEKFELYAASDIYLLPSYTEGCPNSVLEALSTGLFCITTPVGALPDLIIPEHNGLLVKEKSAESIFEALMFVLSTPEYNKHRVENAKKYSEQFDIGMITKNFEKLYYEIVK